MALTRTTLAQACTNKDLRLKLTSSTSLAVGMLAKVNDEFTLVQKVADTPVIDVERGQNATLARAHNILSLVVYGYPYDFGVPIPTHMYTYGAAGAIVRAPGLHRLAGGSAIAMTLSAPKVDEEGMTLLFLITTAYAHTITLDSGDFNNEAHSQKLVFAAAIGNCLELMVVNGAYVVTLNKNITLPSTSTSSSPSASVSPSSSASSSPSAT